MSNNEQTEWLIDKGLPDVELKHYDESDSPEEQARQQRTYRITTTQNGRLLDVERPDGTKIMGWAEFSKELAALERDAAFTQRAMEALEELSDKLDAITEATTGLFVWAQAHGYKYTGPTYEHELVKARALLHEYESREARQ